MRFLGNSVWDWYMVVSLNYCSQNGGNLYRAPYYNGNPNIGPRIIGNLDPYPYASSLTLYVLGLRGTSQKSSQKLLLSRSN